MAASLIQDRKTVAEFEKDVKGVLKQVRSTKRPMVITKAGKPDVVIQDAATYEWELHCRNLARLLEEAEEDIRAGRVRPLDEVFDELIREAELACHNHKKREKRSSVNPGRDRRGQT
jgi:prevent-host-death family protein